MHHVGVVVTDMQRSIEFYEKCFGAKTHFVNYGEGEEMAAGLELAQPRAQYAFLDLHGSGLELLEFQSPVPRPAPVGEVIAGLGHQICVRVDNLDDEVARLRALGVEVGSTMNIGEGAWAGRRLAFAKDPDGLRIELLEMPPGDDDIAGLRGTGGTD